MRVIGVPAGLIVANLVRARKAGLDLTVDQLQSHVLSGGNAERVTLAMIAAQRAQIPLEWQRAAAIDLAGRNVLEALQTSVTPKVIETPVFQGVAQNGIQLNVKARITVRSNLDRYVGGAGEPTIVARVGEGVVSAVGAAIDHKEVLEYPDRISKAVLAKGLDAGTAFEIVSIDIADVDVGKNIGAELQTSQAEADRRIAQAKAAERQYAALAAEQEMKAETQRMRAKVVEAEAQVPIALAEAFRAGNLGVMDYYRINNIKADTEMRGAIGAGAGDAPAPAAPQVNERAGVSHAGRRAGGLSGAPEFRCPVPNAAATGMRRSRRPRTAGNAPAIGQLAAAAANAIVAIEAAAVRRSLCVRVPPPGCRARFEGYRIDVRARRSRRPSAFLRPSRSQPRRARSADSGRHPGRGRDLAPSRRARRGTARRRRAGCDAARPRAPARTSRPTTSRSPRARSPPRRFRRRSW